MDFLENPISGENKKWYDVETNDFFPILHPGDKIQTRPLDPAEIHSFIGRLCIAVEQGNSKHSRLGVLSYGRDESVFVLKALNGAPLKIEFFTVTSVVSMVLLIGGSTLEANLA